MAAVGRKAIAKRLWRMGRRLGELVEDIQAWNEFHPDERPLDCEIERVAIALVRQARAALKADRMGQCGRLVGRLAETLDRSEWVERKRA